jgi:hypothetical protein
MSKRIDLFMLFERNQMKFISSDTLQQHEQPATAKERENLKGEKFSFHF